MKAYSLISRLKVTVASLQVVRHQGKEGSMEIPAKILPGEALCSIASRTCLCLWPRSLDTYVADTKVRDLTGAKATTRGEAEHD